MMNQITTAGIVHETTSCMRDQWSGLTSQLVCGPMQVTGPRQQPYLGLLLLLQ
jgi:hypothetical protein